MSTNVPDSPDPTDSLPTDASPTGSQEVRDAAISGARAMGIRTIAAIVLSVASKLAVGRLLSPAETSIFNTGSQITGPVQYLGEGCLGTGLIHQEKEPDDDDLFSVFVVQLGITLVSVTTLLIGMPWILKIYHLTPSATPILIVLSLCLLISAQRVLPILILERQLKFSIIARVEMVENIISVVTLISLALSHLGVWALTLSFCARLVIGTTLCWYYVPWRPRGTFRWSIVQRLAKFGVPQQLCAIAPVLGGLWLAPSVNRFVGDAGMGFVGMASTLAAIPMMLSAVLNRIAFSAYSRLSSDSTEQGRVLIATLRLFGITLGIIIPLFTSLAVFLLPYILGDKWNPSIPILKGYCFSSIISILIGLIAQNQSASGRPMERLWISTITGVFSWALGYLLISKYQLYGVGIAIFIVNIFEFLISMIFIQKNSPGCQKIFREIGIPVLTLTTCGITAILIAQQFYGKTSWMECVISILLFAGMLIIFDLVTRGKILRSEIFRLITRLNPGLGKRLGIG